MNLKKSIDRALIIIGKARMGRISYEKAFDELWKILVNIDHEVKTNMKNKAKTYVLYN